MVQGLGCRVGVLEVSSLNLQFWLGFLLLCGALHYPEEESHLLITLQMGASIQRWTRKHY